MNRLKIFDKFTEEQLRIVSGIVHYYFVLVSRERIYKLILQTDSIDDALHLLMIHKESDLTLDAILYEWLYRKDNK